MTTSTWRQDRLGNTRNDVLPGMVVVTDNPAIDAFAGGLLSGGTTTTLVRRCPLPVLVVR